MRFTFTIMALAMPAALANAAMPVAEQNALVQKYCAGCHSDAAKTGGLSLETFDAAHPNPGLAAMLVSKLKGGAMSASGVPMPDRTTTAALLNALSTEAFGAGGWTVNRTASVLTASIVQESPWAASAAEPDLYRLTLTCHIDTHEAEMQLSWAPGDVPMPGGTISASVDGKASFNYSVGNGEGFAILYATKEKQGAQKYAMPLPAQTLTIGSLFPHETVVFPFAALDPTVRQTLSKCFAGSRTAQ